MSASSVNFPDEIILHEKGDDSIRGAVHKPKPEGAVDTQSKLRGQQQSDDDETTTADRCRRAGWRPIVPPSHRSGVD